MSVFVSNMIVEVVNEKSYQNRKNIPNKFRLSLNVSIKDIGVWKVKLIYTKSLCQTPASLSHQLYSGTKDYVAEKQAAPQEENYTSNSKTVNLINHTLHTSSYTLRKYQSQSTLDTVGTVYHLVMYVQSNKIHKVFLMSEFYSALLLARHVSDLTGPSSGAFCTSCIRRFWYVVIRVLLDTSSRYFVTAGRVE